MVKKEQINYERELKLVDSIDEIVNLLNDNVVKLSYGGARNFLARVRKEARKQSAHLKRMEGLNKSTVRDNLRNEILHMQLKEGELIEVYGLEERVCHTLASIQKHLLGLREELDIVTLSRYIWEHEYYRREHEYFMRPISADEAPSRIPIIGKPKSQLSLIGNVINKRAFENSGLGGTEITKEFYRQLAGIIREEGYCSRSKVGFNNIYWDRGTWTSFTQEQYDEMFDGFIQKTNLPVGTLDGVPIVVYHPKIIRQVQFKR